LVATVFQSRHANGITIYDEVMDLYSNLISNSGWGVLISGNKNRCEFLVPDCFRLFTAIPLTPKLCLYSQTETKIIDDECLGMINSFAISSAIEYVFAKDLSKCLARSTKTQWQKLDQINQKATQTQIGN